MTNETEAFKKEFLENGALLFNMGKYEELERLCLEFLETNTDDNVYAMLSSVQYVLGNISGAEKAARKGLLNNRENPDLLYNLACILQIQGRTSNALRYFVRASKNCDDDLAKMCNDEIVKIEETTGKLYTDFVPERASKRVLVIAAIYPPRSGSGVQRTVKLVKYLRFYGWEPIVVTPHIGSGPVLSGYEYFDELPDDIKVYDIPFIEESDNKGIERIKGRLASMLSDKTKKEFEHAYNSVGDEQKAKLCQFPEPPVSWAYHVADTIGGYVDMSRIDLIYSTSAPFMAHFAAYHIKEKHDKPWVADFRDEWSQNPVIWRSKDTLWYRMCLDCEQKILEKADRVICVTEQSIDIYLSLGVPKDKVSCITNGYDEEDFEGVFKDVYDDEKFTLIHNGLLYGDRTPFAVLDAIKNLIESGKILPEKILFNVGCFQSHAEENELKLAAEKAGLEQVVTDMKYMEHYSSLKWAAQADMLVLILGKSEEGKAWYPGKTFEYLRLGKPVLCLGPKGSAADILLEKFGLGFSAEFDDVKAIEELILHQYNKWLSERERKADERSKIDVSAYERLSLTGKHAKVFDEAVQIGLSDKTFEKIQGDIVAESNLRDFERAVYLAELWLSANKKETSANKKETSALWLSTHKKETSAMFYLCYAVSLNALGRFDEALQAHKKVLKIDPSYSNKRSKEPVTRVPDYDEYESDCIGCGCNDTEPVFVTNISLNANVYGVINPLRVWKRCENCGLVYIGNMPSFEPLEKYYDEHFKSESKAHDNYSLSESGNIDGYLKYSENRLKRIEELCGKPGKLLDVGTGIATFVKVAIDRGWEAVGLESNPEKVKFAKEKWGIELITLDFFDYKPDAKYDAITMFEVIEHLINPWEALDKCASLLKPDGILVIATPFWDSDYVKAKSIVDDFWWNEPSHLSYMDTKTLVNRAKQAGLTCVDICESEQGMGRLEIYFRSTW